MIKEYYYENDKIITTSDDGVTQTRENVSKIEEIIKQENIIEYVNNELQKEKQEDETYSAKISNIKKQSKMYKSITLGSLLLFGISAILPEFGVVGSEAITVLSTVSTTVFAVLIKECQSLSLDYQEKRTAINEYCEKISEILTLEKEKLASINRIAKGTSEEMLDALYKSISREVKTIDKEENLAIIKNKVLELKR